MDKIIEHCIQVSRVCSVLYGEKSKEMFVGLYHDYLEDKIMDEPTLASIVLAIPDGKELMDAIVAISRNPEETYFSYIQRVKQNPLATRVKIADLIVNLFLRDTEPQPSLKKRYVKAIGELLSTSN